MTALIKSRIRGSFFGVLIGDCIGSVFEGESFAEKSVRKVLSNLFKTLEKEQIKGILEILNFLRYEAEIDIDWSSSEGPRLAYTDDTAMSIAMARTLIANKGIGE